MSNQLLFTVITFNSLVLFLEILVGLIDVRSNEVQFPALLLLTFGFFAGFAQPKHAWQFALLLGIWVPIFGITASTLHVTDATSFKIIMSFLAIVFALAGAYAGVFVQWAAAQANKQTGMIN